MKDISKQVDFRNPLNCGIKPVWNCDSKILMVGSITSIDGMKSGYYYSSRYNSFWKLLDFVVMSKRKNLSFDKLDELFKQDKSQFVFSVLKQKLNDNYKNNFDKNDELFNKNRDEIQKCFEEELLKSNIAICDIFKFCYAKKGSSLDSDLILNNKENYPFETYEKTIHDILINSKVDIVVPNSDFVKSWLTKFKIKETKKIDIIQVASPSSTRRLKLSVKFDDWKTKLFKEL